MAAAEQLRSVRCFGTSFDVDGIIRDVVDFVLFILWSTAGEGVPASTFFVPVLFWFAARH